MLLQSEARCWALWAAHFLTNKLPLRSASKPLFYLFTTHSGGVKWNNTNTTMWRSWCTCSFSTMLVTWSESWEELVVWSFGDYAVSLCIFYFIFLFFWRCECFFTAIRGEKRHFHFPWMRHHTVNLPAMCWAWDRGEYTGMKKCVFLPPVDLIYMEMILSEITPPTLPLFWSFKLFCRLRLELDGKLTSQRSRKKNQRCGRGVSRWIVLFPVNNVR